MMVAMDSRIREATSDEYYDSDSFPIMLDNRASKCLTNVMSDFISQPKPTSVRIKGIGGARVSATFVGTVRWCFEDDSGKKHDFVLPGTYYSSAVPGRILSLQHWAQVANDNKPRPRGTYSATFDDCIELFWSQRQYKKTVPYCPNTNVATMRSAPGYRLFRAFCAEVMDDEPPMFCYTNVVSDDESSDEESSSSSTQLPAAVLATREPVEPPSTVELTKTSTNSENTEFKNNKIEFSLDGPLDSAIVEDEEVSIANLQHELMHWHYRLGHTTMPTMVASRIIYFATIVQRNNKRNRSAASMHIGKMESPSAIFALIKR
jgi:hypothetical protein